jgi:hypothetical protein
MSALLIRKAALFEWLRSSRRMTLLAIGLSAVGIYEAARAWYRPFVYSQGVNDFHVADTLGNSLGTTATVFVFASIFGRSHIKTLFVLRAAAIAVAGYELLHPLLGKPIDPYDLLATVLAGLLCQGIYRWVYRRELTLAKAAE